MITANYYSNVTGELDKAVQTSQEEIESYPRASEMYNNLGTLFALQGQYEKAAEITKQAVRFGPDSLEGRPASRRSRNVYMCSMSPDGPPRVVAVDAPETQSKAVEPSQVSH